MTRRVVVSRVKTPAVKTRTVSVVYTPQRTPQVHLTPSNTKKIVVDQPPKGPAVKPRIVSHKHVLKEKKRKTKTVKHQGREPTPESHGRIRSLRNVGLGKILVIIANGPSILEAKLEELKHHRIHTMMINRPFEPVWPTTYWSLYDAAQFRLNSHFWDHYGGICINSTSIGRQTDKSLQIKNIGGKHFSRDMTAGICIGMSSTYGNMQIAHWMGYSHTYIFGVDMSKTAIDGKYHHYGTNTAVDMNKRIAKFDNEAKYYDEGAKQLSDEERSKYTFCSSYLQYPFKDKFKHLDHRLAVPIILEHAESLSRPNDVR